MDRFFDWYLWLFPLLGIFAYVVISKKKIYAAEHGELNKPLNYDLADDYRVSVGFALLVFLPLFLIAGFRDRWFADTTAYVSGFLAYPDDLSELNLNESGRGPGFIYFSVFIKQFISSDFRVYLLIIAAISTVCLAITYRKYTSQIVLCAFFFFASTDLQSWMMNGIRQFLAASVLFACTPLILSKKISKWIIFLGICLLMYTFHISVIVAIPIYFMALGKPMNKKTITVMVAVIIAVIFIGQFTDLVTDSLEGTSYESSTGEIFSEDDDGTNIFRVLFYSLPAIVVIIFRKKIPEDTSDIINFCINMSIMTMAFYILSMFTSGIYFGRLPIYFSLFNYILIPWEINTFIKKENRKTAYLSAISLYVLFYIIQMTAMGI